MSRFPFLRAGSYAVILYFGGNEVIGNMTLGVLVAFQGLMFQFLSPIQEMLSHFGHSGNSGSIDRIEDIFSQTSHDQGNSGTRKILIPKNNISFFGTGKCTFGYQKLEEPLLENLNLKYTGVGRLCG